MCDCAQHEFLNAQHAQGSRAMSSSGTCEPQPHPQQPTRPWNHSPATGDVGQLQRTPHASNCHMQCQHIRAKRRRSSSRSGRLKRQCWAVSFLSLTWPCLALAVHANHALAQLVAMDAWASALEGRPSDAFELAFAPLHLPPMNVSLQQFDEFGSWLLGALQSDAHIKHAHELQHYLARELVFQALQHSTQAYDEAATLSMLDTMRTKLAKLPASFGYPITRRAILGTFVKHRLSSNAPFSAAVQQRLDAVMIQLFQLHKQSCTAKGVVQFFHISKAGGTNLCAAAQQNNCTSEGFDEDTNCLIHDFSDAPRWVSPLAHKYVLVRITGDGNEPAHMLQPPWFVNFHKERKYKDNCRQRQDKLRPRNVDFFANEFTLPFSERWACPQFVNIMMWRNPLDRLQSQVAWIQKLYRQYYPADDVSKVFAGRTSGFWERLAPAAVNNYYVRSLLGNRFFEHPMIEIETKHVRRAQLQVMLHDVLLLLEERDISSLSLSVGLGWSSGLTDTKLRSSSSVRSAIQMPADYPVLEAHNAPDMQVYKFVREMAALDLLLWRFVATLDRTHPQLNLQNTEDSPGCGYVNAGKPPHTLNLPGEDAAAIKAAGEGRRRQQAQRQQAQTVNVQF